MPPACPHIGGFGCLDRLIQSLHRSPLAISLRVRLGTSFDIMEDRVAAPLLIVNLFTTIDALQGSDYGGAVAAAESSGLSGVQLTQVAGSKERTGCLLTSQAHNGRSWSALLFVLAPDQPIISRVSLAVRPDGRRESFTVRPRLHRKAEQAHQVGAGGRPSRCSIASARQSDASFPVSPRCTQSNTDGKVNRLLSETSDPPYSLILPFNRAHLWRDERHAADPGAAAHRPKRQFVALRTVSSTQSRLRLVLPASSSTLATSFSPATPRCRKVPVSLTLARIHRSRP